MTKPEPDSGEAIVADIRAQIAAVADWPKPGIIFRDITTLLQDGPLFSAAIDAMAERIDDQVGAVAGIEARGFVFASALAYKLGVGMIPIRKPGKLPREVLSVDYELEYGVDQLQIHRDALPPCEAVVLVDDLIATGGTATASVELIRKAGGAVDQAVFLVALPDLAGVGRLGDVGVRCHHLVEYRKG